MEEKIKKHHDRPDLVGEHTFGDTGQLILLIFFLIIWISDSFILNASNFWSSYIPLYIRIIISSIILITGFIVARKGLRIVFGEQREKPELIRKGIFNKVRHPIYLGAILFYLGLFFLSISLIALLVISITFVFYYYISRYEEKILVEEFGESYIKYKKEVPMFFPRIYRRSKSI
ncbi:methyltransferase family protein [Bacteroidota bacterium]